MQKSQQKKSAAALRKFNVSKRTHQVVVEGVGTYDIETVSVLNRSNMREQPLFPSIMSQANMVTAQENQAKQEMIRVLQRPQLGMDPNLKGKIFLNAISRVYNRRMQ